MQGTFGNLLLAVDDRPHDVRAGCRTLPVRQGPGRARTVLAAPAVAGYAGALLLPGRLGPSTAPVFLLLVLPERVLLPAALWALTGRTALAVAVVGA
ncbi:hypothetical protein [Streptomyces sp. NPDC001980]|uniref:hypothetical protein n=1 Tax=Streptomyces sp. NPDC001980 TaxID=3157126 RepID=UPI00331C3105